MHSDHACSEPEASQPPERGHDPGANQPEELIRLDEFRDEHPGVVVGKSGFRSGWNARFPLRDGERFLHRADLTYLLDDAEIICAGGDPRAHPD